MIAFHFSMQEALRLIVPLAIFVAGMVIYSIFIFKFYRFLARKDIFSINLHKYDRDGHAKRKKFFALLLHLFKYLILFPVFTFIWFIVLSLLLAFLTKAPTVENILLLSMAVVGAVRITAYYNEDLSKDLAKMLPFALLAMLLIDISYFSFPKSIEVLKGLPAEWNTMAYYLAFVILMEFTLRILYDIYRKIRPEKDEAAEKGK